jgi:hypothetical protein
MLVQELAGSTAGKWVATSATRSHVRTGASHVEEVVELIARRSPAAQTDIAAGSIGEIANI